MIKRLAPSSYGLKLAEGVRVQEILAFLTYGLIREPGSSNTYMILIQFLMVRLTQFGLKMKGGFARKGYFCMRLKKRR